MTPSVSSIRVVPASGQAVTGVGKYRYIAMLAEGGMADVYLAVTQSAGFEKLVVIKQLRPSLAEDPSFVAMFMDEARLAARLNHPNVVQTLEVGTDETTAGSADRGSHAGGSSDEAGLHFIAMEFLEGVAYVRFARLRERVPPPLAFHVRILVDVLRGLHYAHELRDFDGKPLVVVHRDVSPQNVMLTFAGGVKVLDFGIAKAALAVEQRPEDFKGKLEYMAPEQAALEDVDRRADVFSVGVMLWEALARRRLYRKGDDKLALLLEGRLPDVLSVAPSAPKRLAAICAKAMAHHRDDRYPTADAMADDLEEWLGTTTQHVTARDVGSYVADKFSSTRAKISAAIEAQLALFRSLVESAPDTIPLSRLPGTDAPPPDFSEPPPPVSLRPGMLPLASAGSTTNVWATGDSAPVNTLSPQHTTSPPGPGKGVAVGLAIVALAGIGALSGIVAVASHERAADQRPPSTPAASATPVEASAPAAPVEAPQIDFTIKASPPEARIYVDGKPLGSNPANGTRARDSAIHMLRIEAPGYAPREESITFDRSLLISIELRPSAAALEAPTSASASRSGRSGRPVRSPRGHGTGKGDPEGPSP